MKQNELLNVKPGRDLDIRVALEVMGYVWLKHLLQFSAELAVKWLGTPADAAQSCGMYVLVPESQFAALKERENHDESVLSFSTDMVPASKVIDRMQEMGYEYHLETKIQKDADVYYVFFERLGSQSEEEVMGCEALPEAIVKAALTATSRNR